jgi:HEPN domain-containing protein
MTRAELQRLARDRLCDAKVLLAAGRWSGAYYLAGYAVECGLKSCIIAYLMRTDQFPERKFSEQCWTHNLGQLVALADLKTGLDVALAADRDFLFHWAVVRDRKESSRYLRTTKVKAVKLYQAITDKKHGVLRWILSHW